MDKNALLLARRRRDKIGILHCEIIKNNIALFAVNSLFWAREFEQIFDYQLEADKVNIELKFVQSDFSQDLEGDGMRLIAHYKV